MYEAYALDRYGDARSWSVTQVTPLHPSHPRDCGMRLIACEEGGREGGRTWEISLFGNQHTLPSERE